MERKYPLPADTTCPDNLSELDWLANQTPAVIELAKELYRQIRPFCTEKSCKKNDCWKV